MAFLGALFGTRNINDPNATCKNTRGIINVEVRAHQNGVPLPDKPVKGVTANVQGPDCPNPGVNGVTGGNGIKGFGPYHLGNYTVDLNFPPDLVDRYDLPTHPVVAQTKALVGGVATQYTFTVVWHWIEFQVRDGINQPVDGLDYKLHHQAPVLPAPWTQIETGKVPLDGNIKKVEVKRGQYRLRIVALRNPQWSAATIVIGTPITLTAEAAGFDVGTAGSFDILDAFDQTKTIFTVNAAVVAGGPPLLQAVWTPQTANLSNLKQCQVVFRAKCETASVIGPARKIYQSANIPVTYSDGTNIAAPVTLYFSDDSNFAGNAAGGQLPNALLPWGERVLKVVIGGAATSALQIKNLPEGNKRIGVH